ncbi:hypothetical protein [Noviherbaspirillum sp.]|uniref:hypothetical protein n=1 Tax=Noviherbaspirillum sp. TaxID=1926288 RepID=UPI002B491782|nr:hypothetical protein [Noviherbaspirillum sp.]HJV82823.1 hypothetical protein [Noviherbaspirillum sp.]
MPSSSEPLIDADHADFMQRGVGIGVAACDSHNIPTLARAIGCRVSPDRRSITVFISATQAAPVLKCVRDNGAIAVVFSEPSTHRTVQVKGKDVVVGGLVEGDQEILADYRTAFMRQVSPLGHAEVLVGTLLTRPSADIVSLSFTPYAAFSQTPGPKAGEPLQRQP